MSTNMKMIMKKTFGNIQTTNPHKVNCNNYKNEYVPLYFKIFTIRRNFFPNPNPSQISPQVGQKQALHCLQSLFSMQYMPNMPTQKPNIPKFAPDQDLVLDESPDPVQSRVS